MGWEIWVQIGWISGLPFLHLAPSVPVSSSERPALHLKDPGLHWLFSGIPDLTSPFNGKPQRVTEK